MIVRIEGRSPSSHAERQPLGLALPLADAGLVRQAHPLAQAERRNQAHHAGRCSRRRDSVTVTQSAAVVLAIERLLKAAETGTLGRDGSSRDRVEGKGGQPLML
jgi:hypothetical protein